MDNENTPVDLIGAAEAAIKEAKATVETAKTAAANAVTEAKTAAANLKQVKAYSKSVDAGDAETTKNAKEALEGWVVEAQRTKDASAAAKAANVAAKDELKAANAALRAAKADTKKAEAAAKKVAANTRITQNGMTQPREGTLSATLWSVFDTVAKGKGSAPAFSEVLEPARAAGIVDGSIRAGYAHWRKFHGITGRVAPVAAAAPVEPAAPAAAA